MEVQVNSYYKNTGYLQPGSVLYVRCMIDPKEYATNDKDELHYSVFLYEVNEQKEISRMSGLTSGANIKTNYAPMTTEEVTWWTLSHTF